MHGRLLLAFVFVGLATKGAFAEDALPNVATATVDAAKADRDGKFIRIRRNGEGQPLALETAIVHYQSPEGAEKAISVDLIGAVHIADKSYFDALNKRFTGYDVVLYELVAPEGSRIPKGGREGKGSGHPIAVMQDGMKSMLELEHQLDQVDYTVANLVHADMSPIEFEKSMETKGENSFRMLFRLMGQAAAQQATGAKSGGDVDLLTALFAPDRPQRLKLAMAEQFENLEGQMAAFEGPDGSTIITERNKKALEVLKREVDSGKLKLAVFYGAGHLSDMQKRLEADFNVKRTGEEWLQAWSLDTPKQKNGKAPDKVEQTPAQEKGADESAPR